MQGIWKEGGWPPARQTVVVKSVDTIGYYQHIATLYAHYSHKELQKGREKSTEKARQPNVLPQPHDKHHTDPAWPTSKPRRYLAWRAQYLRRLTADAYPYRWLDTNAYRQTKKTQLALCPNYPFASGSVFKLWPGADAYGLLVLIPLNQGLFLNFFLYRRTHVLHRLNPFESGSVFKQ